MARVTSISTSSDRGVSKKAVPGATFLARYGIEGDAHAVGGDRQVSILLIDDIQYADLKGAQPQPGDFSENLVIDGFDHADLHVGARLEVGPALLEITQFGNMYWEEGDFSFKGVALVDQMGFFARVIRGGWVSQGDDVIIV